MLGKDRIPANVPALGFATTQACGSTALRTWREHAAKVVADTSLENHITTTLLQCRSGASFPNRRSSPPSPTPNRTPYKLGEREEPRS